MYFLVSFNVLRHKVPVFQLKVMVYAAVRPFVQPTNLKTVKHVVEDLLLVSHPMKSVITENDVVAFLLRVDETSFRDRVDEVAQKFEKPSYISE